MEHPVLNRRQEQLVALVRQLGYAEVDGLATQFDVTQQTIRRDLMLLCEAGLLRRYHGGVSWARKLRSKALNASGCSSGGKCPHAGTTANRACAMRSTIN